MKGFYEYDIYIFDCDGVVLDSNGIKIDAMERAIRSSCGVESGVEESIRYFKNNFGRSRFHHVRKFLESFLVLSCGFMPAQVESEILEKYAAVLEDMYKKSNFLDGFQDVLNCLEGEFYVASGSEQEQLLRVLQHKLVATKFTEILGSPTPKTENVKKIISGVSCGDSILMIGDSLADLEAAEKNNIDFWGIFGVSNTPDILVSECRAKGYPCVKEWSDVRV